MTENKIFIPLSFDLLFKKVFGNPDNLIPIKYLIKTILNIEPSEVIILNSELIGRPYKDKMTAVDLIVELEDKTKINIEVNTNVHQEIVNRNFYFLCRNMSKDLEYGSRYSNLNKHLQINFDLTGKHSKPIMTYSVYEDEIHEELTNLMKIIRIDVPFFTYKCYNEDISKLDNRDKFIGLFGACDINQIETLCEGDEDMENIGKNIKECNNDLDVMGAYDYEFHQKELARIEKKYAIEEAVEEAVEETYQEATKGEKNKIARNMLKMGLNIDLIMEATGISRQELEDLKTD